MKVALYYPWVYLTSGAERSILELTGCSRHRWTIFTNRFEPDNTFPGFLKREIVVLGDVSVKRTFLSGVKSAVRILTQRLPLAGFDALVIVCEGFGDLLLFRNHQLPTMCLCLTPLRLAFDIPYRDRFLSNKGAANRLLLKTGARLFGLVDQIAWKHYGPKIAISTEAKRRVVAGRLAKAHEIEVLHPGIGFDPKEPSRRSDPFFLLPGRVMWTKNLELGINAFLRFREQHPEFQHFSLTIAGIVDRKSEPYLARLQKIAQNAGPSVHFHIHPSDEELGELYRTCYGTLFTAFNEDWGIVPLESMAFGKPVIAVNRGGPRESVEDGVNGFLVEPDEQSFADCMAKLVWDTALCERIGSAGHKHAKKYSWRAFAGRIDEVIDSMVPIPAGQQLHNIPVNLMETGNTRAK